MILLPGLPVGHGAHRAAYGEHLSLVVVGDGRGADELAGVDAAPGVGWRGYFDPGERGEGEDVDFAEGRDAAGSAFPVSPPYKNLSYVSNLAPNSWASEEC